MITILQLLVLVFILAFAQAVNADTIIEKRTVEVSPTDTNRGIVISTPAQNIRSAYGSRLDKILDQINLGYEKGWLTSEQTDNLKKQQADIVRMHIAMLEADGGVLSKENSDRMETLVNGLSIAVTDEINEHK